MEKKKEAKPKTQTKKKHPRKYPQEVVDKVVVLIKEGKALGEILEQLPPRKRALLRIAKRYDLTIKK